jgi:hypothetical protein
MRGSFYPRGRAIVYGMEQWGFYDTSRCNFGMNVKSGSREGRAAQHLGHLLRFSPLILRQLAAFNSSSPILLFIQVLFLVDSSNQLCRPRRNLYSSDGWDVLAPSSMMYSLHSFYSPPSLPVTSTSALAEQLRITPSTWSRHGVFPAVAAGFPGSTSKQSLIYHPHSSTPTRYRVN